MALIYKNGKVISVSPPTTLSENDRKLLKETTTKEMHNRINHKKYKILKVKV